MLVEGLVSTVPYYETDRFVFLCREEKFCYCLENENRPVDWRVPLTNALYLRTYKAWAAPPARH